MSYVPCKFCTFRAKTEHGLQAHINTNRSCIALQEKKRLEEERNSQDCKPKGKKKGHTGKRKASDDVTADKTKTKFPVGKAAFQKFLSIFPEEKVLGMAKLPPSDVPGTANLPRSTLEDHGFEFLPNSSSSEEMDEAAHETGSEGSNSESDNEEINSEEEEEQPEEAVVELEQGNKRAAFDRFQMYCEDAKKNFIELTSEEVSSVKLMHFLLRKKASLDTYQGVMRWHMEQRGLLREGGRLGECSQFISREALLKFLRDRYFMNHQYAKPSRIVLPHSKSKVVVWRKQARDNVLSLLTDPRWTDDDWLYANGDPSSPPPWMVPLLT